MFFKNKKYLIRTEIKTFPVVKATCFLNFMNEGCHLKKISLQLMLNIFGSADLISIFLQQMLLHTKRLECGLAFVKEKNNGLDFQERKA